MRSTATAITRRRQRCSLAFADFRIDVETNSLRLASRLQSYFADYLAPDARRASRRACSAIVRRARVRRVRAWRSGRRPSTPGAQAEGELLRRRRRALHPEEPHGRAHHAVARTARRSSATLERARQPGREPDRHAVRPVAARARLRDGARVGRRRTRRATRRSIFLGNSGSGKSSLALQLIERGGYDFLSNDRVLMQARGAAACASSACRRSRASIPARCSPARRSRASCRARVAASTRSCRATSSGSSRRRPTSTSERELGARSRLDAPCSGASTAWSGGPGVRAWSSESSIPPARWRRCASRHKDFGPYDLRGPQRDAIPEYERIARAVPFIGVSGRADPRRLAGMMAAP